MMKRTLFEVGKLPWRKFGLLLIVLLGLQGFMKSAREEWRHARESISPSPIVEQQIAWISQVLRRVHAKDYTLSPSLHAQDELRQHLIYDAWPLRPDSTSHYRVLRTSEDLPNPSCENIANQPTLGVKLARC